MDLTKKAMNENLNEVIELQNTLRHYKSETQINIVMMGIIDFINSLKIYGGDNFENEYKDKLEIIRKNISERQQHIINKFE